MRVLLGLVAESRGQHARFCLGASKGKYRRPHSHRVGKAPQLGLQTTKPHWSGCAFFLLLRGEHTGALTPKWLAMQGTGRAGTQRAAEFGSSPIDPTTPAALEPTTWEENVSPCSKPE
jgi:hypothetical protein